MNKPSDAEAPGPAVYVRKHQTIPHLHTAVKPKNDIVLVGRISALEIIKEQMSRLDVDVPHVGARK